MSIKVEIKVDDLARINKQFDKAPDVVNDYLQKAINAALPEVQSKIRRRTPVVTGRLRGGIEIINRATMTDLSGLIGSTVEYGPPVHRRIPFMTMGLDDSQDVIMRRFEEAVKNIKTHLGQF